LPTWAFPAPFLQAKGFFVDSSKGQCLLSIIRLSPFLFLNTNTHKTLAKTHRRWVESQLKNGPERQEHFSASIAVGSQAYIQKVRQALGIKGIGRRMAEAAVAGYQLKESLAKYDRADLNKAESHQSESPVVNTIPWKWERP
jgi:hypothetical protein